MGKLISGILDGRIGFREIFIFILIIIVYFAASYFFKKKQSNKD